MEQQSDQITPPATTESILKSAATNHPRPKPPRGPTRPLRELQESGLLWLINRAVFHPRGFALAIDVDTDSREAVGWSLLGDGAEPWATTPDTDDEKFRAAEATLEVARRSAAVPDVLDRLRAIGAHGVEADHAVILNPLDLLKLLDILDAPCAHVDFESHRRCTLRGPHRIHNLDGDPEPPPENEGASP